MHVLYTTPKLSRALDVQLRELDELRRQLAEGTHGPEPWLGQLRHQVRASTVESSVSIEGFTVPAGEAAALVAGDEQPPSDDENRLAVASYARAMDHVGIMSIDPGFSWSDRAILDLHFDACYLQRDKLPGLFRTGPIDVTSPGGGPPVYEGPAAETVPTLMAEAVEWLQHGD